MASLPSNQFEYGKRESVGKLAHKLAGIGLEDHPIEYQRAMFSNEDVLKNLQQCINTHNAKFDPKLKEYYVVILTKKERLWSNVIRTYFLARATCPSPNWDQAVFKYDRDKDELKELWVIPDEDTCKLVLQNLEQAKKECPSMASYCVDLANGKLTRICAELNAMCPKDQLEKLSLAYGLDPSLVLN